MEKLVSVALVAWNPVGAVSRRLAAGELNVKSVLAPFAGVYLAAAAAKWTALREFSASGVATGDPGFALPPSMASSFPLQVLGLLLALLSIGAIGLLPRRLFEPFGRPAAVAAAFILFASQQFYGAVGDVVIAMLSMFELANGTGSAMRLYLVGQILAGLALSLLMLAWTWRVLRRELALTWGAIIGMFVVTAASGGVVGLLIVSRLP